MLNILLSLAPFVAIIAAALGPLAAYEIRDRRRETWNQRRIPTYPDLREAWRWDIRHRRRPTG
jgi:hypothetical protein